MEEEGKRIKLAVIAGASRAIQFKEKNPRATEQEVIQHVSDNLINILEKVDRELD